MTEYKPIYSKLSGIYFPESNISIETQRSFEGWNWQLAKDKLLSSRKRKPSISEFVMFLDTLRKGDADMQAVYNDITVVRSPYRGCWLNASFEKKEDGFYLQKYDFDGRTVDEKLDDDTLMTDIQISLEDWLDNPTKQGLPRNNIKPGSLYYWHPRDNTVARFGAGSGRASLVCGGHPEVSVSGLGVFACAEGTSAKFLSS